MARARTANARHESGFIRASQQCRKGLSMPANAGLISSYEHSFANVDFAVALAVSTP
jgi:hypothetical protein